MRFKGLNLFSFVFALFFVFVAGTGVNSASAQNSSGKWSYFKFKPGQFFKYEMKSERGLKGWASIKVEDGGGGAFNVTLAGKWTTEFSETIKMKPGMSAFDFVYSARDIEITNALDGLLNVDAVVVENTIWQDGFKWSQGDKSIEVKGEKVCAGLTGLVATYSRKFFGRVQKRIYGVNSNFPLPIFVEVPAANDTWTYELLEKRGT